MSEKCWKIIIDGKFITRDEEKQQKKTEEKMKMRWKMSGSVYCFCQLISLVVFLLQLHSFAFHERFRFRSQTKRKREKNFCQKEINKLRKFREKMINFVIFILSIGLDLLILFLFDLHRFLFVCFLLNKIWGNCVIRNEQSNQESNYLFA